MRKVKVLLVVPLHAVAGTELSTLELANGLKEAGHEVYVMVNQHPLSKEFADRGLAVVDASMERSLVGLVRDAGIMARCISEKGVELVHFQSAFPIIMSLLAWRTIKTSNVKLVWTCRGVKRLSYVVAGHVFNDLLDYVIANCDAEKDKLIRNGLSPLKVRTIYNCPTTRMPEDISTDVGLLAELGLRPGTPVVGTASRLHAERGVKYFLDAAAIISAQMPQARFLIAGGGPQGKDLRQQANRLGIEQKVFFLGARRDMDRIYPLMDVFVNPALVRCGTDNVNIEAMAFARPVVISDVGGGREIVEDGVTGFVVPVRDGRALAEATMRLLRDGDLVRRMGMAGREKILKDFTVERLVLEVEDVYLKVLA